MGFKNTGLGENDMIITNQDYDNDSLFLSEKRKDKEKEGDVPTQSTLVRGLEYKGLPRNNAITEDGNKYNDPLLRINSVS